MGFNVTWEIVTPESAEFGDAESRGFISEGVSLRDAIGDLFETRTCHVDGVECVECDSSPVSSTHPPRWVTVRNGMEYLTGAQESRSLHIPPTVTGSSAVRIARLVGAL